MLLYRSALCHENNFSSCRAQATKHYLSALAKSLCTWILHFLDKWKFLPDLWNYFGVKSLFKLDIKITVPKLTCQIKELNWISGFNLVRFGCLFQLILISSVHYGGWRLNNWTTFVWLSRGFKNRGSKNVLTELNLVNYSHICKQT